MNQMIVRQSILFCIAFFCLLAIVSCSGKFPKFRAIPYSSSTVLKTDVVPAKEFTAPTRPKRWYASWPTGMRMTLLGNTEIIGFALICHTDKLEEADQLSKMEYCFDGKCTTMTTSSTTVSVGSNNIKVSLTFDKTNGGRADYPIVPRGQIMTTAFSCSVTNRMGTVKSNTLNIVDLRKRFPANIWMRTDTLTLYKNQENIVKCMENGVSPGDGDPPYVVSWFYCEQRGQVEHKSCIAIPLRFPNLPMHLSDNGNLFMPYLTDDVVIKLQNRQLLCKVNQIMVSMFNKVVTIANKPEKPIKELQMVLPKKVKKMSIYDSPNTRVQLPCNFKIGRGEYSVNWVYESKDGKQTSIESDQRVEVLTNPHAIKFKGPFNDKTAGKYVCKVGWTMSEGGGRQTAQGIYDVEVLFYPSVSEKMVPLKYVVDGQDGKVQCLFKGLQITPSLSINGKPLEITSSQKVDDSVKTVNTAFKRVMASLKVNVKPLNPKPGQPVTYTAEKMYYNSALQHLPSTHTVGCTGKNRVGEVRTTTLLKVVPKPILVASSSPAALNCSTECSATVEHTVQCVVSNKEAINKSGVIFGQYWQLGGQRIDDLIAPENAPARKFLIQSPDSTTLTIKKIDDLDFRNQVNELRTIECVLTLGYPDGAKLPEEVKSEGVEKGLFFISSHSDMRSQLSTPIKLTNIAPPALKTGNMAWLIAVVLAFLIILIIIGILYAYCRRRKSGEEYNVDAKEKQQGNDPEVEVAEKEAFPVYERPEDGPIRGSRASLDDSIHVGSDDEDEVLAEYDVDIGKFDEEGSFIGQYAVNDGPSSNRRLPQVGNNTEV